MKRFFILTLVVMLSAGCCMADNSYEKSRIDSLLSLPGVSRDDLGGNMAFFAEALTGCPSDSYYHTDSVAVLRLNTRSFTPMTFINTVGALSRASLNNSRPSWRDFSRELTALSCRRGTDMGFPSLMWHASDWISDNIYRGNVKELTENFPGTIEKTKSLDYLTRHRDEYRALADSATYEKVRMMEMGFRTHRVPLLKKEHIGKKDVAEELRPGDIIILNPQEDGIDIRVIGVVVEREDGQHLIYLSEEDGKVVETPTPLPRWMKIKTKYFNGFRIIRLQK